MMSMYDCIDRATNISYAEETKQKTMAFSTIKQKLGEERCDVKITFICKPTVFGTYLTSLTCLMLGVFC